MERSGQQDIWIEIQQRIHEELAFRLGDESPIVVSADEIEHLADHLADVILANYRLRRR